VVITTGRPTLRRARAVRRLGSAALDLCYVAAGRFDGFWEQTLKPWDVAAGGLIVREAGGRVTGMDGSQFDPAAAHLLASNGRVHDEMLADGSLVLYNGCRQQVLTLNPTAALVWEYCDGEHSVDAIVDEIAGVFPSEPRPDLDVRTMLDSFLQTGLIMAERPS